ncbi:MAG: M48 family metalloprotease [Thiobacillaceae bacterium]
MLIRSLLIFSLLCNPLAASELPDLGEVSRQYFSDQEEQTLSRTIMRDIYADPQYLDDPEIEAYLENLGYRLVSVSSRNQRDFTFFVIQDHSINAFALPGGNIGVHTGLLLTAQNESELASVLGHEIAHVTQNHIARMVAAQSQSYWPTVAALALALLASRANPNVAGAAIASTQALSIQNQLNFTREYEREADRIGFETLAKAGFDPRGMPSFFNKLQRANRLSDTNAPAYLRTHPLTSERIADMEARAESTPYVQIASSIDFHLVRARLRAEDGTPQDAVKTFKAELLDKRYSQASAAQYGLVLALLRARNFTAAETEVQKLVSIPKERSPMIASLNARVAQEAGQNERALDRYRIAVAAYPGYRPILYGYADALFNANKARESVTFVETQLSLWPHDRRLWRLAAQAHSKLGQRLQSHRALAEAFALAGNLVGAIEQINLGVKAGDGGFQELSAAETRRREWIELEKSQKKQ